MKLCNITAFATVSGALIASSESHAAYLGLGTQLHTTVSVSGANGGIKSVYRIYAIFSNPNDQVTAISASEQDGTLTIQSLDSSGSFPGSNFFNNAFGGGQTAPPSTSCGGTWSPPSVQWDTFATIGVDEECDFIPTFHFDQTQLSPGFPTFITGNQLVSNDMSWFIVDDFYSQGLAGGPFGKPGLLVDGTSLTGTGILIMQLTVSSGGNVAGTVAVNGISDGEIFSATGQTFASFIPSPGALPLCAGVLCFRSRRRR